MITQTRITSPSCSTRRGTVFRNVFVVEIFTPGGATPPNTHSEADEFFYVLSGKGVACCGTAKTPLKKGDALVLHPGNEHIVHNTGTKKLCCLTVMTPRRAHPQRPAGRTQRRGSACSGGMTGEPFATRDRALIRGPDLGGVSNSTRSAVGAPGSGCDARACPDAG